MSLLDENAEVLRRLEAEGRNLGPPRQIDFSHLLPDKESADAFAEIARRVGFLTAVKQLDDDCGDPELRWDVSASKHMSPTCEDITETEVMLDSAARQYGGRADGWGFFDV